MFRLLCCAAWLISPLPGAAALPPEDLEVMTESPRDDFSPVEEPESLWANQLAYMDTGVNRLTSGTADPVTNGCASETTHLQDSFTAPVLIYFYSYFRDYQNNLPLVLNLYRPDVSLRRTQTYHPADGVFYTNLWLRWKVDLSASDPAGTWRFEAAYNGQTYSTYFNLNAPTQITLNSPNSGEQWEQLRTHPVSWADNLGGAVNLALYQNGVQVADLASSIPSDGAYAWRWARFRVQPARDQRHSPRFVRSEQRPLQHSAGAAAPHLSPAAHPALKAPAVREFYRLRD